MSTNTYVALKTTTVTGSAAASVSFDLSGITGYADLVCVVNAKVDGGGGAQVIVRVGNSTIDTGTNYSRTGIDGNGTSATSFKDLNIAYFNTGYNAYMQTSDGFNAIIHFMNYANTTTYKTMLARPNNANTGVDATVGLWRSTSAIDKILLYPAGNNFAVGSTFTVYGIANADVGAYATGGVITQDANYYYHAFGSSSTFTPTRNLTADILVVAGGGGGGGYYSGGGGGAGGLLAYSSQSLTNGTGYTCTIGAGGAGGGTGGGNLAFAGSNSQFASLTASVGGGQGGNGGGASTNKPGSTGGSGGGGGGDTSPGTGGSATSGQGNAGAIGTGASSYKGGGGGGAGTAGTAGTSTGNGGDGSSSYSSWLATTGLGQNVSGTYYIAGGGGGGAQDATFGTGGLGGGGNGGHSGGTPLAASNAQYATGGGGGGSGSGAAVGGNGGSGLIVVRYAK